jgi:hypothetical protein
VNQKECCRRMATSVFSGANIELVPPRRPAIICASGARTDRAGGS